MLAGTGVLACSAVCFGLWLWRFLLGSPPWGRLMLLALMVNYLAGRPLVGAYPWAAPVDSVVSWGLLLGLVLRWRQLRRQSVPDPTVPHGTRIAVDGAAAPDDEAARWAAGALGENIVGDALAQLGHEHFVIHNLPLAGRGDVDHVVVGPAGAVVIETKYLAGRIVCRGDGVWMQVKRDEVRQIADPAAQVQRAVDGVVHILERRGVPAVPVYALVVMAHPRAELNVERSSVLVVRPRELVPRLHQLAMSRPQLDAAGVTACAAALVGNKAPSPRSREWSWR
jgi:hypothetical protein